MLDEDSDLDFVGLDPNDSHQTLLCDWGVTSVLKMLKTGWRKTIPALVNKSFLRRKLLNRFWLVNNLERVAAVTQWTRWW